MAKQTKRIQKNILKTQQLEKEAQENPAPQHRPWETIILVAMICLTLIMLTAGWEVLDVFDRGMYASLCVALIAMYVQRRYGDRMTPTQLTWLSRLIFLFISVSLCLFGCVIYFNHFA